MKKLLSITIVALALFLSTSLVQADTHFDWREEVNPRQCDKAGRPVVNVVQNVVNDADSGLGGYWAFDKYIRHIQVWGQQDGSYCALVSYYGTFDAQAGQPSPGNTGTLDGNEDGFMQGGYRAIIDGTLKSQPSWPRYGSVGTFDYQCNLSGDCPGRVSWPDQYFESGYGFSQPWWGWIYRSPRHGVWINSIGGNSGDIN
ncbi:hypothetical protein A3E46_00970 [Candidatus Woesebacteria bacterium RIFCSPHIGHO2_12_FULL_46_16]|uniref:Secreted protein n=1 Tax=Candidatus Woesebacteria bacterium RIFCSPHIGHO2_12_FULL_46_16 TaxID=1802513 RepID=A0A1F8AW14_9BACT|nr:MAG: hypothetical protein A3E46_00970 [Candidatus Woesebacteria bacterium RIFCSPHIGHO2_12_FULL_46_16]